jgi:hypothetical protein
MKLLRDVGGETKPKIVVTKAVGKHIKTGDSVARRDEMRREIMGKF